VGIALQIGLVVLQLALGAALAGSARWLQVQVRTRNPASRIWCLNRSMPVHIIVSQEDAADVRELIVKVYAADYLAAVEARALVTDTLRIREVDMVTSSEFRQGQLFRHNLVCVGGPVNNRVTRLLLQRITVPVHFDGYAVVSEVSGQRYEAIIDQQTNKIIRDVGVAVMVRNPFEPSSSVVLLMGARTFGVAACSHMLTARSLRKANATLGMQYPKWAILDVDVIDDFVARIEVLESSTGRTEI
jgi:hypothetical protein